MLNKLALGTAQFGLNYGINNTTGKLSDDDLLLLLNFALSNGVELLDTAVLYGNSEERIGIFHQKSEKKFKIISKLPDCEIHEIESLLKGSLKRLHCKKLYGYLFHSFSTFFKNKDSLKELGRLKEESLVEKIGFSVYKPEELKILFDSNIQFDLVQLPYNLFDRRFESLFEELKIRNVEIHIRSVFLQGLFFKDPKKLKSHFISVKKKLIELRSIADEISSTIFSLALCFVLHNKYIDKVVVGVDNVLQLEQIINTTKIEYGRINNFLNNDFINLAVDDEAILIPSNWE